MSFEVREWTINGQVVVKNNLDFKDAWEQRLRSIENNPGKIFSIYRRKNNEGKTNQESKRRVL